MWYLGCFMLGGFFGSLAISVCYTNRINEAERLINKFRKEVIDLNVQIKVYQDWCNKKVGGFPSANNS